MFAEKDVESSELFGPDPICDTLEPSEKDMGKDGDPSDSISSVSSVSDDASGDKIVDQSSALEQHVHHAPTKGHTGTFQRSNAKDNYTAGGTRESSGYYVAESNGNQSGRTPAFPSNSVVKRFPNFSEPVHQRQAGKPPNKFGSSIHPNSPAKGFHPAPRFSSRTNQNHGAFVQSGPVRYQSNGIARNDKGRYKSQESAGRNRELGPSTEMTRGPRFDRRNNSAKTTKVEQPVLDPERYKYNLEDFLVEYNDAKFYMIKSISEDDVHKSIKYNVWSSTPSGNRKLDAAFEECEAKSIETGKECPVFLFFSVTKSWQFLGVAEMVGPVDFTKDLDFWQTEEWNSFFPITWHIIKDVPTVLFQHIILENNYGEPVTRSRDTQEIGLKQGLEMLSIFKNYSVRTSIVDDFNFYENRERARRVKRKAEAKSKSTVSRDRQKHYEAGEGSQSDPLPSLQNLSLNSYQQQQLQKDAS